jgi:pyrroloquinoline quinone biosynthesis protein B
MRVKILGSAAGGGFPQWNCSCENCRRARNPKFRHIARTQTQIAFSHDGKVWFLVGASPDLRTQIINTPELSPNEQSPSNSPIGGVFLPSADVDEIMGLLHLREFQPFFIFGTASLQRIQKKENKIFNVLDRADPPVQWRPLKSKGRLGIHLSENPGDEPSFVVSTISLGGSYPDYVSEEVRRTLSPDEANIGFVFEQHGKSILVAPSISGRNQDWAKAAASSSICFLDGTFWSDDELTRVQGSGETAHQMGHIPVEESLRLLKNVAAQRKMFIHLNNTNPMLDEASAEHRAVRQAGWEVAEDNWQLEL